MAGMKPAPSSGDASGKRLEVFIAEMRVLVSRTEIASVENVQGAPAEVAPVAKEREHDFIDDGGVADKVGDKRPAPDEVPALFPLSKKS